MKVCWHCDRPIPTAANFCTYCGRGQDDPNARRRAFAAAPGENVLFPRLISTLFPHLPRASLRVFRASLALATLLVVIPALVGAFGISLVVAGVATPLLAVFYTYEVDVYEDEPIRFLAFSIVSGATFGVVAMVAVDHWAPITATTAFTGYSRTLLAQRCIVFPIVSVGLMLAGPLALLPYRKFNDVLDGTTLGVCSAVGFVGAGTLASNASSLRHGLRPSGATAPWVEHNLQLAMVNPILAAAAIGAVGGALWFRFRAPRIGGRAFGPLRAPVVAFVLAAALLIGASYAQLLLSALVSLVLTAALAAVAVAWLRVVIHVGLLQEEAEIPHGDEIVCANCGLATELHSFCQNCGISLAALPKAAATSASQ